MMPRLLNQTKNKVLASDVEIAKTFATRSVGLLGRSNFAPGKALWIHRCNSIHTWFMKFTIDAIFVDKNLRVRSIRRNVKPWRIILPVWAAWSVFELPGGALRTEDVGRGDLLHVGD